MLMCGMWTPQSHHNIGFHNKLSDRQTETDMNPVRVSRCKAKGETANTVRTHGSQPGSQGKANAMTASCEL